MNYKKIIFGALAYFFFKFRYTRLIRCCLGGRLFIKYFNFPGSTYISLSAIASNRIWNRFCNIVSVREFHGNPYRKRT